MALANAPDAPYHLVMLSLDTAIDENLGDLSVRSTTWTHLERLLIEGRVAASLAGPPCNTFSEARHYAPTAADMARWPKKRWPRPLRSAARPWGLEHRGLRGLQHLRLGSQFALQTIWVMARLAVTGGLMLVEHPGEPSDPGRPLCGAPHWWLPCDVEVSAAFTTSNRASTGRRPGSPRGSWPCA